MRLNTNVHPVGGLVKHQNCTQSIRSDVPAHLQFEGALVFLPIIRAIDASRTVRGIKADGDRRSFRPATNIEDTRGLVRKHNGGRAPRVHLDMHLAPGMFKIVDETQVEFVCASGVFKLRRAVFLDERDLAIYTDGGNQRRYETGNEVLCQMAL